MPGPAAASSSPSSPSSPLPRSLPGSRPCCSPTLAVSPTRALSPLLAASRSPLGKVRGTHAQASGSLQPRLSSVCFVKLELRRLEPADAPRSLLRLVRHPDERHAQVPSECGALRLRHHTLPTRRAAASASRHQLRRPRQGRRCRAAKRARLAARAVVICRLQGAAVAPATRGLHRLHRGLHRLHRGLHRLHR